jgi:hypothetical protein
MRLFLLFCAQVYSILLLFSLTLPTTTDATPTPTPTLTPTLPATTHCSRVSPPNSNTALYPDQLIERLHVMPDHDRIFDLCDLKPGASYEVRLSYLGTAPVAFKLYLIDASDPIVTSAHGRRLLDVEKLVFHVDDSLPTHPAVLVETVFNAIAAKPDELRAKPVPFNVVLSTLHAGVIPHDSVPVIFIVLVVGVLCIFVISPALYPVVFAAKKKNQSKSKHT